jgi:hypothetical protein
VNYDAKTMLKWRESFYARCRGHMKRVRQSLLNAKQKRAKREEAPASHAVCVVSDSDSGPEASADGDNLDVLDVAPKAIAFTGKRQFQYLFQPPLGYAVSSPLC